MLRVLVLTSVAVLTSPSLCMAEVLISELMYNPASSERFPNAVEWVELYNAGNEAVSLEGWYLKDEDGRTKPLKKSASIDAGQAVVLIPGVQMKEDFHAAWGEDVTVYRLPGWGRSGLWGLSNSADGGNEKLTLRKKGGALADAVNFAASEPWPALEPEGASIYLSGEHLSSRANDKGENWRLSKAEQAGARQAKQTSDYAAEDVGSPGHVSPKAGPSGQAESGH